MNPHNSTNSRCLTGQNRNHRRARCTRSVGAFVPLNCSRFRSWSLDSAKLATTMISRVMESVDMNRGQRTRKKNKSNNLLHQILEPRQLLAGDAFHVETNYMQSHLIGEEEFVFTWEPIDPTASSTPFGRSAAKLLSESENSLGLAQEPITSFIPALESLPDAPISLFLDFDGHYESQWGNYSNASTPVYDIDGDPTTFSETELSRIHTAFEAVSEDFAPFNVNVTTVEPAILGDGNPNNDNGVALRVAIGGSWQDWYGSSAGGVGYVNSFTSSIPNVVYVFSDNTSSLFGETSSHEAGHGFGLHHQSLYDAGGNLIDVYNPGTSEWQPIMGGGTSSLSITSTWHNGPIPDGPYSYQDDLAILSNTLGYRADDHSDITSGATNLGDASTPLVGIGIIETNSDVDVFSFTVSATDTFRFRVDGVEIEQNLDAVLELRNSSFGLIATASPSDSLDAELVASLPAGDYFVAVTKSGNYGWLGQYTVNIDMPSGGVTVTAPEVLTTVEGGQTATLNVVLDTQPTADVTIAVSSSDPSQGTPSVSTLTFTPSNWNTTQTVTITGTDDAFVELPGSYQIEWGPVVSADPEFDGLVIAAVSVVNQDNDTPGWAFTLSSDAGTVDSQVVRTGPSGNIYVAGRFDGTVDFDPGPGVSNLTAAGGNDEGYLAKFTPTGELVWAQHFGGDNTAVNSEAIEFDDSGDVYLSGSYFSGSTPTSFGPYSFAGNGNWDAFVTKLDASGSFQWVRSWGGENLDVVRGLAVGIDGSVHVSGYFSSASVDFDPGIGTYQVTSSGGTDAYLLNLDASGNFVSVLHVGGENGDYFYGVDADSSGDLYLAGRFYGTAQFGTQNGVPVFLSTYDTSYDAVVMKVSLNGSSINTEWVRQVVGTETQTESRVAFDGAGGVYFTSQFRGSIDFDTGNQGNINLISAGSYDSLVTQWGTDGDLQWFGQITGAGNNKVNDVQFDGNHNPYFTGEFIGTTDFNFPVDSTQLTSPLGEDTFILGLDSDGSIQYETQIVQNATIVKEMIAVDEGGNIYVTGGFRESVAFPTGDFFTATDSTADSYVVKLIRAPGISVSPSTGLVTNENGGTLAIDVVLDTQPTADVTINLRSSDVGEGTVSPSVLTFTPENWNVAQSVTVSGANDAAIDGDVAYTIVTSPAISSDPAYNGVDPIDVSVTNLDDDQPLTLFADSFEVSEWNGLWVEDNQNDWRRQTQRATEGSWSAEVDGLASNATLTVANAIDLSQMQSATLTFDWLIESGFDRGEFLSFDISTNGGTSWQNDVRRLSGNVDSENTWHAETVDLGGYLTSNFKFRFRSSVSSSTEDANVDNVSLVGIPAGPANEAPVASNDSYILLEDGSLNVAASGVLGNDTDTEGDTLAAMLASGAAHGSVTLNADGSFVYTPEENFNGPDSFSYVANDGTTDSNLATVNISVNPVNDIPVAFEQSIIVKQETAKPISLSGSDIDGDSLTYWIQNGPTSGSLSGAGAEWIYTPNGGFTGPDSFSFYVNDGTSDSDMVSVSLTVSPNHVPVADSQSVNVNEDGSVAITLSGSDVDGDSITFSLVGSGPDHGTLSGTAPNLTYVPDSNYNGLDSFTFFVNDGTDDSQVATVSMTVVPVNDAPIAHPQSVVTAEETSLPIVLTGSDIDGDGLTFSIVGGPVNGSLTGSGAAWTYTPNTDFNGSDSFTFRVNDGVANSSVVAVSIGVTPVNDAPVASGQSVTTNQDTSVAMTLGGSDIDGDSLTFIVTGQPAYGNLSGSGANLTYTPQVGYVGSDSFTYIVNDGTVDSDPATVQLTIEEVASEVVLFEDSFEFGSNSNDWNGNWVEDSQNDFFRSTQRATDGVRSAEVDGRATNATLTLSAPINLSIYAAAELTFDWLIESGFDSGEYLSLDISTNGGASWNQDVRRLRGNVDSENTWHSEIVDLTPYSSANLLFRFRSRVSGSSEDANVDNVKIIAANTGSMAPLASEPTNKGHDRVSHLLSNRRKLHYDSTTSRGIARGVEHANNLNEWNMSALDEVFANLATAENKSRIDFSAIDSLAFLETLNHWRELR